MSLRRAALFCAVAATTGCGGCEGLEADDGGNDGAVDVAGEAAFVGCPLAECYGVVDLPVGAVASGEDTCTYFCLEAGAPWCQQGGSCSCRPNPCDGSPGSCACVLPSPLPGPGCVIPTCSGTITLPRGTSSIPGVAADGCKWYCETDGAAYCAQPPLGSCTCGVSACDAGTSD